MPDSDAACPLGHAGEGYRLVRDGRVPTKAGRKQVYICIAADGTAHRFRVKVAVEVAASAEPAVAVQEVRCPRRGHKDATIQSKGPRTTKTGAWRRFLCRRPNGETHYFRLMESEDGPLAPAADTPPPPCLEHPGSGVARAGTFGIRKKEQRPDGRRQRYLCTPTEDQKDENGVRIKPHQFTPRLSRGAVSPGEACKRCDELLSPHHGPVTAARHTPWTLVGVAQALNDLSLGESYASVSLNLRAQRDAAWTHLEQEHGIAAPTSRTGPPVETTTTSYTRRQRRNAWRIAADLVEQYVPPLFADVEARYRQEALAARAANDVILAANPGAPLAAPIVYVIDELAIWTQESPNGAKRPSWNVLSVVEVRWKQPPPAKKRIDADAPMTLEDPTTADAAPKLPERVSVLRLARAFPRANADAWKLVFDELGARPDFVVADAGAGLQAALRTQYGATVGVVPSLWHVHKNLRDLLVKLPNATFLDGEETALVDPLRKQLGLLKRDELIGRTERDIKQWWDELDAIVMALPAPVATLRNLRSLHEPRIVAALPILTVNPQVPASNSGVENFIRMSLKPFLANRAHLFGNQERTNRLLNLLVCRQAGVFTNLDALTLTIRTMNEGKGGWAPAPRQILDKQRTPTKKRTERYESLKSHSVIVKLAKGKGITTNAQAAAAAPMPLLSKQRPSTAAAQAIRDWARALGLPAGASGPIRSSVKEAYAAAQGGASDEAAKAVYERVEAARLAANAKVKKENWPRSSERERAAELAPVRAWAKANGIALPANHMIPKDVMDAYAAASTGKKTRRRPSRQPKRDTP